MSRLLAELKHRRRTIKHTIRVLLKTDESARANKDRLDRLETMLKELEQDIAGLEQ